MYNVAFRYTEAAGGMQGVVTWTGYESKEAFLAFCISEEGRSVLEIQEVVEEGITPERAIDLVRQTPAEAYITAAYAMSTNPNTGRIERDALSLELTKAAYAIGLKERNI